MDTIESIEDQLGYKLPDEYKTFLRGKDNDRFLNKGYHRVIDENFTTDSSIDEIIRIENFWQYNKDREYLFDFEKHFENAESYVEAKYLYFIFGCVNGAICMVLNGNHRGKIYSVDNGDFGIIFQAENLKDFLKSLY